MDKECYRAYNSHTLTHPRRREPKTNHILEILSKEKTKLSLSLSFNSVQQICHIYMNPTNQFQISGVNYN